MPFLEGRWRVGASQEPKAELEFLYLESEFLYLAHVLLAPL